MFDHDEYFGHGGRRAANHVLLQQPPSPPSPPSPLRPPPPSLRLNRRTTTKMPRKPSRGRRRQPVAAAAAAARRPRTMKKTTTIGGKSWYQTLFHRGKSAQEYEKHKVDRAKSKVNLAQGTHKYAPSRFKEEGKRRMSVRMPWTFSGISKNGNAFFNRDDAIVHYFSPDGYKSYKRLVKDEEHNLYYRGKDEKKTKELLLNIVNSVISTDKLRYASLDKDFKGKKRPDYTCHIYDYKGKCIASIDNDGVAYADCKDFDNSKNKIGSRWKLAYFDALSKVMDKLSISDEKRKQIYDLFSSSKKNLKEAFAQLLAHMWSQTPMVNGCIHALKTYYAELIYRMMQERPFIGGKQMDQAIIDAHMQRIKAGLQSINDGTQLLEYSMAEIKKIFGNSSSSSSYSHTYTNNKEDLRNILATNKNPAAAAATAADKNDMALVPYEGKMVPYKNKNDMDMDMDMVEGNKNDMAMVLYEGNNLDDNAAAFKINDLGKEIEEKLEKKLRDDEVLTKAIKFIRAVISKIQRKPWENAQFEITFLKELNVMLESATTDQADFVDFLNNTGSPLSDQTPIQQNASDSPLLLTYSDAPVNTEDIDLQQKVNTTLSVFQDEFFRKHKEIYGKKVTSESSAASLAMANILSAVYEHFKALKKQNVGRSETLREIDKIIDFRRRLLRVTSSNALLQKMQDYDKEFHYMTKSVFDSVDEKIPSMKTDADVCSALFVLQIYRNNQTKTKLNPIKDITTRQLDSTNSRTPYDRLDTALKKIKVILGLNKLHLRQEDDPTFIGVVIKNLLGSKYRSMVYSDGTIDVSDVTIENELKENELFQTFVDTIFTKLKTCKTYPELNEVFKVFEKGFINAVENNDNYQENAVGSAKTRQKQQLIENMESLIQRYNTSP